MQPGKLRGRVSIERQTTAPKDAMGGYVDEWVQIATRRCNIEPVRGTEFFTRSGEQYALTTEITMRYDTVVNTARPYDRLVDKSVSPEIQYDIISIINDGNRNREIKFLCRVQ